LNALCHGCILTNSKAGIAQLVERNLAKALNRILKPYQSSKKVLSEV